MLVRQLADIYKIQPAGMGSGGHGLGGVGAGGVCGVGGGGYTICGLPLPDNTADIAEKEEELVASALGYVAQCLFLAAKYLEVPLR